MPLQTFHTAEEIAQDIFQLEGIVVQLSHFDPEVKFLRLYSEQYKEALSSNQSVQELDKRIKDFIARFAIPIDLCFVEDCPINLFAVLPDEKNPGVHRLENWGGFQNFDDTLFDKINSMEFPSAVAAVHIASEKQLYILTREKVN